ncbi:MAG: KpsF/GutQ family sugar-phosphate isomerase [Alphaproteobacteria bacterium]|nr:KpsF/GutQ family sugar-phosphate isomerase [Alphaproteobacteria bacterium]
MSSFEADQKTAVQTINAEIEALKILRDTLNESLTQSLDLLQKATGRVIVTGMGKSGHIGKKIVASLASTGTPAFFVHPAEASHGDLGMITQNDVVIAISNSGESKELVDIVYYCKRFDIPLIAMTKNPNSSLGKAAMVVLPLPNTGEACPLGLAPTSSSTATLVLGDVLTTCLIERRGFTKEDFNIRHPGGKLGAILKHVGDLMHVGAEMPVLNENVEMQEAVLEMSRKRLGCVGFVDEKGLLTGILTDGDLRRKFSGDTLHTPAKDLMTRNPVTITKGALSVEAIKLMNERKITNLFVVENGYPVGTIHIHDLLGQGVA